MLALLGVHVRIIAFDPSHMIRDALIKRPIFGHDARLLHSLRPGTAGCCLSPPSRLLQRMALDGHREKDHRLEEVMVRGSIVYHECVSFRTVN